MRYPLQIVSRHAADQPFSIEIEWLQLEGLKHHANPYADSGGTTAGAGRHSQSVRRDRHPSISVERAPHHSAQRSPDQPAE